MLLLIYRNLITSLPAGRKSATFCHDPAWESGMIVR